LHDENSVLPKTRDDENRLLHHNEKSLRKIKISQPKKEIWISAFQDVFTVWTEISALTTVGYFVIRYEFCYFFQLF